MSGMTEEQIAYMRDRFLSWKFPKDFIPDGGISYKRPDYDPSIDATPTGTNLLGAMEAEGMIRHLVEGLPKDPEILKLIYLWIQKSRETFAGNIDAVDKLGLDAFDFQPVLCAVQMGEISTGRARELLRCWVLGTAINLPPLPAEHVFGEDDEPHEIVKKLRADLVRLQCAVDNATTALAGLDSVSRAAIKGDQS